MRFSDIHRKDANRARRLRVMKRYVIPKIELAIMDDIRAGSYPDISYRAELRLKAKHDALSALKDVIPYYIEAGGDINSFQYDLLHLMDRHILGSNEARAYWGRMATDVWRAAENDHDTNH